MSQEIPEEPTGEALAADELFPEQDEPDVRVRRPITVRGVAIVGVRTVAGLVGIGVAVATVAASALLPLPTLSSTPPSQLVTPVPTAQQLVCPGGFLRLADDTGAGATTVSSLGRPTLRSAANSGAVDSIPVETSDASTGGTPDAPAIISTPPDQNDPTAKILLSGAQSQQLDNGDFVGLAASACSGISGDSWLVGGSTTVGRTTLLTLTNPTEVPATVDVELFGESGRISAPGTSGIVVAPSGQRVLSLAGFQPDVVSPVVHVTSTGGQVAASLQQAIVRGLDPGGIDIADAGPGPSTQNIIPGVVVGDVTAVQALRTGGESFRDVQTVLRLFAPGQDSATATINVIPEDAAQTGRSFTYDLNGGQVADVPLEDLATGGYTITVDSAVPLVAAARVTAAAGAVTDFAWFGAAPALTAPAQVTAAPGVPSTLHLYNPGTVPATVTLSGSTAPITVPPGTAAFVALDAGSSYGLSSPDRIFAAVSISTGGMVAHYSVYPPGAGSTAVTVYR